MYGLVIFSGAKFTINGCLRAMVLIEALFKDVRPAFHGKNCQYQSHLLLAISLIENPPETWGVDCHALVN